MREMKSKPLNKGNGKENEMGFFTLENGTEMNILEMVCAKKVAYLNSEDEGIIHDFSQKIIEEAAEVAAYDHFFNENISRKGRNRKTKWNGKRNADKAKRYHRSDRKHGKPVPQSDKKYMDSLSGTFYRWDEKRKTFDSYKKPVVHRNRKTFRDRLNATMDAKEKEYIRLFTGVGELLEDINYLENRIRVYEEDIEDLEYEKAFGYLSEEGEEFLEDYKKELEDLRKYKEYKEILLRTI